MTTQTNVPARAAKRLSPHVAGTRADALAAFRASSPGLRLAPVTVVIAALDEAESVGSVVDGVPARACGLATSVLVVDDGSADGTAEAARAAGAHVARLERNCGHGIALRVGYQLARELGARFIVTLDGDGQWDPSELERVLEPVAAGEADLVLGSRVLGRSEIDERLRLTGVRVFAALTRLLTGARITDTSTGYRAMRSEVTATVPQRQTQYQTAELLIGAVLQGYRVVERPIVQRRRMAGRSKKGNDLLYGLRYARVILVTWLRERPRRGHPAESKPARAYCR
ncbi:MAG TPA: glycosyltransferase family 2 protein [Solirubrobacteraceae bacterium]|nr:glycosyltransferase family 2 protein [Solirubrobacteraceae bacterium]